MNAVEIMLKVLKDTNNLGFIHSFEELEDAIKVGEAELARGPVAEVSEGGLVQLAVYIPADTKLYTREETK